MTAGPGIVEHYHTGIYANEGCIVCGDPANLVRTGAVTYPETPMGEVALCKKDLANLAQMIGYRTDVQVEEMRSELETLYAELSDAQAEVRALKNVLETLTAHLAKYARAHPLTVQPEQEPLFGDAVPLTQLPLAQAVKLIEEAEQEPVGGPINMGFACPECGSFFSSEQGLKVHVGRKHG